MPMGWSWSLLLAQSSLERMMVKVEALRAGKPESHISCSAPRDRCPSPKVHANVASLAPYLDNGFFIAWSKAEAEHCVSCLQQVLGVEDFIGRIECPPSQVAAFIGIRITGISRTVTNKQERSWKIYFGIRALLKQKFAAGDANRVIMGHIFNAFQVQRICISCRSELWQLVAKYGERVAAIPDDVAVELRVGVALILIDVRSAGLDTSNTVFCTDASTEGYSSLRTQT